MTLTGAFVVFVISWWLCFFVALPIGIRGAVGEGDGTGQQEPGAPLNPEVGKKARWASMGAAGLTALLALAIYIFDFEALFLRG